ncbi:MAG: protein kinase [Planctomycetes bacterium]|nr:protein kinase [Planctomycetota bacterium]
MSERLLLEIVAGGRPPAELPRAGTLVLGSSKERAGFQIEGTLVADVHAAIGRAKGGGWAIRDLGSEAGTKLNGKRVDAARLRAGDRIELGSVVLRIVDPADPLAAAPAELSPSDTAAIELEETPPRGMTPVSAAAPAAGLPPLPGYKLEKRIGRGGMGEVYLAVQERLARQVAIKVLAPRLAADAQFVQRFEAEARSAAALNHPNVVTVYDVGTHQGVHYLSMEFMDRGTLEERVQREGPLPWKAVLDILRDAASGLAYAESRGIVHRDLKPANLMQNHAGSTKIADLGLATHIEAEERAGADQKVFGTAHFIAPEQARGEKVDHRCDLYALGATAYRLLTAHTPFEGATSRDILRALLREEPRPIGTFAPDVPAEMVALVERLMRKDPLQRTASANVLLREIEALRGGVSQAASRAASPSASSSKGLLVGGAVLVLAAAGWFALRGKHEPEPTPRPLANGTGAQPPLGTAPKPALPIAQDPAPALPDPGAQPEPPADPAPTASSNTHESDDRELELFETKARVALLEIKTRSMEPAERVAALRDMAQKFNGTTSATEALDKANALENEQSHAQEAEEARHAALLELAQKLREAAKPDEMPPAPGRSILAMRAVAGQEAYLEDPLYKGEVGRLQQG